MNLLVPLYMLGALAIAIPIILHLRRRPPKDRVVFSSLMFLSPDTPQRKKRSQLEHWLLLLLRCLALLLLALMFSRPFFKDPNALAELTSGTVRVAVIDRSASMQREGLWQEARKQAQALVNQADSSDRLALLTFDSEVQTLVSFDEWTPLASSQRRALATSALSDFGPSWSATAMDEALTQAVGLIEDETKDVLSHKEIVLLSDFQEGASLTLLNNFAWPEDIELRLISLTPKEADNAAAHLVAQIETEEGEENPEILARALAKRVRVTNSVSSKNEKLTLAWAGHEDQALEVLLPPGATRVVSAPPRPEGESQFLELTGDSYEFDNRVYVAPRQARPVEVLYLGSDLKEGDTDVPLFYLQRAFSPTESLAPQVLSKRPGELTQQDLLKADVLVLGSKLPVQQDEWVANFVSQGGVAIVALSDSDDNPAFVEDLGIKAKEAEVADYVLLEGLDFDHPILRPFSGAALRDFSKIHFWKYRELTLPEPKQVEDGDAEDSAPATVEQTPTRIRLLAKFDSGDPAWVEARSGQGRVYLFASSWVPRESQLALSSKFVPLIYSILQVAGFESEARRQFYVGDKLPNHGDEAKVTLPDGSEATGAVETKLPGIYQVQAEGETFAYAVNVPVNESRLDPMPNDVLTTMGITLAEDDSTARAELTEEERTRLEFAELEAQQKIWKWLVLVAVLILLGETWLANRRGSARPAESGT